MIPIVYRGTYLTCLHGTCLSCVLDRLTVLLYFIVQLLGLLELLGLLVRDSVIKFRLE